MDSGLEWKLGGNQNICGVNALDKTVNINLILAFTTVQHVGIHPGKALNNLRIILIKNCLAIPLQIKFT